MTFCISSAVLIVSIHMVTLRVSLGVVLCSALWSTCLSAHLCLSYPAETSPMSRYGCLKGINSEDGCDRHYNKGNNQKLWCWKFRLKVGKALAQGGAATWKCGGYPSLEFCKDPSNQYALRCWSSLYSATDKLFSDAWTLDSLPLFPAHLGRFYQSWVGTF